MNKKILFNDNWLFSKNNGDFENVSLPHDWLIYNVKNLYEDSIGTYKKTFYVDENFKKHFLLFNGIYMDSKIKINGNLIFEWKYGYTSFEFEITDFLNNGENIIEIFVKHEPNNSRWYTGAGIYRDVFLISTDEDYIPSYGLYISPRKNKDGTWRVELEAEIVGNATVNYKCELNLENSKPILWPKKLYTLTTELIKNDKVVFTRTDKFGFREINFDREKGFFLNGEYLKIKGVCEHHDLGALGSAFNKYALKRKINLLLEMGINAIRTAHNPPDPYLMELCDELGILVVSEIFDVWERPKTKNDYSRFFINCYKKDIESWVKRDRNHPSLIMWSIGNEIYDTHEDVRRGTELLNMLISEVLKHDYKNNAFITFASNYLPWENTQEVANNLPYPKLVGYNYGEYLYKNHHEKYKDFIIYGSETAAVVQSRGIYHFPLSQSVLSDDDEQCSSLGNSATSWGAKSTQIAIDTDFNTPFSLGQFIWTGTDYIGEPTPYHTKNSYFGQIDTAGFKKDSFYIYKAAWSNEPMIYVWPYLDFSIGQMIDVQVVTNCYSYKLFLNDIEINVGQIEYKTGILKAIGYDKDGLEIARCERKSFKDTKEIKINIIEDGLVFAEIHTVDEDGNFVENANNRINVNVTNGKLLGIDNGDSTDFDEYKTNSKRLFSGKLLAIATAGSKIEANFDNTDVPIRKIELHKKFDGKYYEVEAEIHPKNATYNDITFRVTDASGIDTNIADFEILGNKLKLKPKGDGNLFVRANTKNGRDKISLISYLDFKFDGYGEAFLNPYELISGGLYKSDIPLTNGNERGVATLRDGISKPTWENIDFGEIGSDEIHIPIFAMTEEPFTFEIWSNNEKILDAFYNLGSQWNTYRTATYKLQKKIKGISNISFVVNKKIHIKGFWFTKINKAYQKNFAVDFSKIYGDSYTIGKDKITNIGNNVTIEFDNMNFSAEKIIICGNKKNSIHLKYDDGNTQILEVDGKSKIQKFNVLGICKQKVSFIFLPGSDFDFEWFKFE
ncbi:MAG: glycoside hydrolase family 2 [Defluviitaleaceae bacterium]|nr:glycoside hydrolase family 2 [Defluviitaleaceae bacterium]